MAVRIGVIGAGRWAAAAHAPGLNHAGAEIVGVLSRSPGPAKKLADRYGARVFDSLTDMAPYVDAVAIATPNDSHVPYGLEAIGYGLHLFVDKPLGKDLASVKRLYEALQDSGLTGLTTLSSRGHPVTTRARELLETGAVGEVLYVRGAFHADFMADPATPPTWRAKLEPSGSGALGDLGAHLFDLASYVSGLSIERLCARSSIAFPSRPGGVVENDDEVAILADLSGGVSGLFSLSRVHTGGVQTMEVEVQGTKGAMRVRPALSLSAGHAGLEFSKRMSDYRAVDLPDRLWGAPNQAIPWDMDWGECVFAELGRRFLTAIEAGAQPSPSLYDGLAVQAVIETAETSAAQGGQWRDVPALD